jgi:hypothetical protein
MKKKYWKLVLNLSWLQDQVGVYASSGWNARKGPHLRLFKRVMVSLLQYWSWTRLKFVNDGGIDWNLFSDEACFHINGYVASQHNKYQSVEKKLMLIHKVPLCDVKVGVWCAISATRIIVVIFLFETLLTFFEHLSYWKRIYTIFCQQDIVTPCTNQKAIRTI